jgi:hypothetical protein
MTHTAYAFALASGSQQAQDPCPISKVDDKPIGFEPGCTPPSLSARGSTRFHEIFDSSAVNGVNGQKSCLSRTAGAACWRLLGTVQRGQKFKSLVACRASLAYDVAMSLAVWYHTSRVIGGRLS